VLHGILGVTSMMRRDHADALGYRLGIIQAQGEHLPAYQCAARRHGSRRAASSFIRRRSTSLWKSGSSQTSTPRGHRRRRSSRPHARTAALLAMARLRAAPVPHVLQHAGFTVRG
jgi:hypothetical protein